VIARSRLIYRQSKVAADALSASSSVLSACAKGILSPSEAAQIMDLISNHVRMFDVVEIEARVSDLEKERKL